MPSVSIRGTLFETPERNLLRIVKDALVTVGSTGVIESVLDPEKDVVAYQNMLETATKAGTLVTLSSGQYLLPGLIDLHVHAPQWPQLGKCLDRKLEHWLQDCTFPLESKYEDIEFASKMYTLLVSTLLANGTTTVAYFATVHVEASVLLAKICVKKGQRAIVGRVAMDLPDQCPPFYRDTSPQASVEHSERFIQEVRALPNNSGDLVLAAVTPRFIPSCSHEALEGLGVLAKKYDCHVQTHCSESDWEHNYVIQRYGKHDAFALNDYGLITRKTILAHSNFLSKEDMNLIKSKGAAVAHCPLSNIYFSSAVFPLRRALDAGLHVGMGSDIAGGPSPSLFDVCRGAVGVARMLEEGTDASLSCEGRSTGEPARVDHVEAFYIATALGGESVDLKIGRFAPGYFFDAIVVDTTVAQSNIRIFDGIDKLEDVFQKIIYNAGPANVVKTYVAGRLVHSIE